MGRFQVQQSLPSHSISFGAYSVLSSIMEEEDIIRYVLGTMQVTELGLPGKDKEISIT